MHKPSNQENVDPSAEPLDLLESKATLSASLVCCCRLVTPPLPPLEHLDDCELLLVQRVETERVSSEDLSDESTGVRFGHPRSTAQKQLHRESMARLRQKLRDSIVALHAREKELEQALRDTVASRPAARPQQAARSNSKDQLRHAYLDLVREQIELQDEQRQLEATRALREKYERLVMREVDKTHTFHAHPPATE